MCLACPLTHIYIFWNFRVIQRIFRNSFTRRDEIAGCSEKAYDYLSINDAKKILMFSSDQELSEYITEVWI